MAGVVLRTEHGELNHLIVIQTCEKCQFCVRATSTKCTIFSNKYGRRTVVSLQLVNCIQIAYDDGAVLYCLMVLFLCDCTDCLIMHVCLLHVLNKL